MSQQAVVHRVSETPQKNQLPRQKKSRGSYWRVRCDEELLKYDVASSKKQSIRSKKNKSKKVELWDHRSDRRAVGAAACIGGLVFNFYLTPT
jgi:hypothetical protein